MSQLVERFQRAVEAARDPVRAAGTAACMRNLFPFAGISQPALAVIYREAVAGQPPPSGEAELAAVALACWDLPEREYQHLACTHLRRHVRLLGPTFVPTLERLVATRSWWDTVDELAAHVAGPLVAAHPGLRAVMDRWLESGDIWLARVAILHQERWRERTDPDLLFAYCLRRAADREFFIRKAIGWALRSYAKVEPEAVAAFLAAHGGELSGLSRKEAERGVGMGRSRAPAVRSRPTPGGSKGGRAPLPEPPLSPGHLGDLRSIPSGLEAAMVVSGRRTHSLGRSPFLLATSSSLL